MDAVFNQVKGVPLAAFVVTLRECLKGETEVLG